MSSEALHAPPATTEAFAISLEVQQQLAQEMQRKKIVMEGDYKECINGLVKEAENQPSEIIIMLEDIKSLSSAFDLNGLGEMPMILLALDVNGIW